VVCCYNKNTPTRLVVEARKPNRGVGRGTLSISFDLTDEFEEGRKSFGWLKPRGDLTVRL
jgi:hypothetical protein